MPTSLPYRVNTQTGDIIDYTFTLHPQTGSATDVARLLSSILATLDREIRIGGNSGNGDVLQALAMALAVRASMIHAPRELTARLAADLLRDALAAAVEARHAGPSPGHA
jgi:hypothetical protein